MPVVKVGLRSLAAQLGVSHQALSQAFRAGTWCRGVGLDAAGKLEVTDPAAALEEWRMYHPPRLRMSPMPRRPMPPAPEPEPPSDRFPELSRQNLIDRWQGENTIALITVCDAIEDAAAADRAARLDRIIAAIASLAAELDEPEIERDALDALLHHVAALDLEQAELDALAERIAAARR